MPHFLTWTDEVARSDKAMISSIRFAITIYQECKQNEAIELSLENDRFTFETCARFSFLVCPCVACVNRTGDFTHLQRRYLTKLTLNQILRLITLILR